MRASIHVDLRGWAKEGLPALKVQFCRKLAVILLFSSFHELWIIVVLPVQERCEELQVEPRGTRGESGGQTGITYDVSNKHRLGYSEVSSCIFSFLCNIFILSGWAGAEVDWRCEHPLEGGQEAGGNGAGGNNWRNAASLIPLSAKGFNFKSLMTMFFEESFAIHIIFQTLFNSTGWFF